MKTLTFTPQNETHFTSYLMDQLKPVSLRPYWDTSLKIDFFIKPFINIIDLITTLGEQEHTGDWDPSLKFTLLSGGHLETQPGYYSIKIKGDTLLIEDQDEDQNDITHELHIGNILTIRLIRN